MIKIESLDIIRQSFINIANSIRRVNGETKKYSVAEMPAAIEELNGSSIILQDKTITENGEYTADSGYTGLSKVTVNVTSSGGSGVGTTDITDGFTARFFDENNNILQVTRVRNGLWLDKPQYECDNWENSNGFVNSFPLLLENDVDFYAKLGEYCSEKLYKFFNIDKVTYPYLIVTCQWIDVDNVYYYNAWFSATEPYVTTNSWAFRAGMRVEFIPSENFGTDISLVTEVLIQHGTLTTMSSGMTGSYNRSGYTIYGNYDNSTLDGRLDQTIFTAS